MVNLILGRAGSGKSRMVYSRAVSHQNDEPACIIVPEQFTYETERNILSALNRGVSFFVSAQSLKRLSYRLCAAAGKEPSVLSDEGVSLAARRAVQLAEEQLFVYKSVSGSRGFLDDMKNFLHELKKNSISCETLLGISQSSGALMYEKLADVAKIYYAYEEILGSGALDEAGFFALAAECARESLMIRDTHFYFDGFYSFDRCSYPLIAEIIKNARSVSFALDYCENEDFFSVANDTVREISLLCGELGVEVCREYLPMPSTRPAALRFVEAEVMSSTNAKFEGEQHNVFLCRAKDARAEAEFAADLIRDLIKTHNYRYRDIQIVCDLSVYSAPLSEAFEALGLRGFTDENSQIVYSSPVQAFLFLLGMAENASTSDIIAYAKTGFADITDDETMTIENYALEYGIKYSMWEHEFTRGEAQGEYLCGINDIRARLIDPISRFRATLSGSENVRGYCARLRGALVDIGFEAKLDELRANFAKARDYDTANIYSQINNRIIEVLEQLEGFFGEEQLAPAEINELISFALSRCTVGVIPPASDRIRLTDVLRSRSSECRVLFVLGANEGALPKDQQEFPILSDEERARLSSDGARLSDSAAYARSKENFLLYTLLSRPNDALYVSRCEHSGEELCEPAEIYCRLAELFDIEEADILTPKRFCAEARLLGTPRTAFEKYAEYSAETDHSEAANKLFSGVAAVLGETPEGAARLRMYERAKSFDNEQKIVNKERYAASLSNPLRASVSMLERYSRCPYSFFAQYVLRPTERKVHRVRPADIGLMLHKTVELFSRRIISSEIDIAAITPAEISSQTAAIVGELCESYAFGLFSQLAKSTYLKRKLTRAAISAISEIVAQLKRGSFLLSETEARFANSDNAEYTPIYVQTSDGKMVVLSGIIDRIDSCVLDGQKYVRIIDYKSGGKAFDLSEMYFALSLQLPVYIRALENERDISAAGVFYFRLMPAVVEIKKEADMEDLAQKIRAAMMLNGIYINDLTVLGAMDNDTAAQPYISGVKRTKSGITMRDGYSAEELSDIITYTMDSVKQLSERILCADIAANPIKNKGASACDYCPYPSVCKFSTAFSGNRRRAVRKLSKAEIMERVAQRASEVRNAKLD